MAEIMKTQIFMDDNVHPHILLTVACTNSYNGLTSQLIGKPIEHALDALRRHIVSRILLMETFSNSYLDNSH